MACLKEYKCKCGYKIAASPKGHDYLMMGEFYHFLCKKCRDIVRVDVPLFEKPKNPVCPHCGSEELERWNPISGRCPKCGNKLKETGIAIMID